MQTIVSNRIHPFFVQVPANRSVLHLTAQGGRSTIPPSSEGHSYKGPIANGHWVDAANLKPGHRLLNPDQSWAEVIGVKVEEKPLTAYNITVADLHTYFVRGADNENAAAVWVHNCNTGGGARSKNKLKPDSNAVGKYTTVKPSANGNGFDAASWKQNPRNPKGWDQTGRIRRSGGDHGGVSPPII